MNNSTNKIAVIGMSCRFPGAVNAEEFWNNLILGKETLTHFTGEEIARFEPYFDKIKDNPDYVRVRGVLKDIDKFDAAFFGMTPKEAAETDPQQRIWLETAWQALENAGCDPFSYPGAIGVFAGGGVSSYLINNILRDHDWRENFFRPDSGASSQLMFGNDPSYITTKTAYHFNLKGPAVYVQTACSTSLVAIVQACQSLYSYDSDVCLAGGIRIIIPQEKGYLYQEGGIPSPDGHCRAFDAKANGTVGSNGVGVVVLKRMEDAIKDNDTIYALVSGWALNNDGSNKVSFAAPSINGQAEVIMMAQSFAEVSPEEIGYIEAHGTATQLGDPIEMAALTKAFSAKTDKKQFCGIGSVKSNIGHTDSAAGVASFIKVCLSAYNKKIPPTLHYSKPNPHIDFKNSPFYVLNKLKEWSEQKPLIMGVSSFGIGGTNAHLIVEQPPFPEKESEQSSEWPSLIVLSAKSEDSQKRRQKDLAEFLKAKPDLNIHDVAYTLAFGRNHMLHRSFIVASTLEEIISGGKKFTDGKKDNQVSKIAFMFPGQGAQYVKMGYDLYQKNKTFRDILDDSFRIIRYETGEDIKPILFGNSNMAESDLRLTSTELTQPALFIIEYGLSKVLDQLDIKPDFMIGHSIGEYTAACLAGVFDFQTALKIVIKRGQLMRKMPSGNMMAVRSDIEKLKSISESYFEIAADNAFESCTISFKSEDTEKVKTLLDKNNIQHVQLNTSHAFHSAAFDPIISEFREYVNQFNLKKPELPFISCLTGAFITDEQSTSGTYWAQQLRNTVQFRQGISTITVNEGTVFLEVGPNTHLSSLVRQSGDVVNKKIIISTLGKADKTDERYKVLAALGNMYNVGVNINFDVFKQNHKTRKIGLPAYPFERKRHWLEIDLSHKIKDNVLSVNANDRDTLDSFSLDSAVESIDVSDNATDKILSIWKSLIGSEEIGLDDDFFEIGGHSLLALQILTRMKEDMGIKISLKEFLDNPTINKLKSRFGFENLEQGQKVSPTEKVDISNFPLSYSQRSIWIISKLDVINPAYNIPLSYKITGELNVDVFKEAINVLFNRHFIIFSTYKEKDGNPYCEIIPKPVKVELLDYSKKPKEKSEKEILSFIGKDTRKQFDLETGPLYRLYLSKQSDSCYFFHGTIHHIVFDGWSFSVFFNDLRKIYDSLVQNKELKLEDVKDYYLDYAKGLQSAENESIDQASAKFWIENLKGCNPKLDFPYDFPRKDSTSGYGEKENIRLPSECTARLKEIARKEHATPFATLLSLLGVLFQRYSGENDICIGTHVANRPLSGLERIFGMFVNTIPVRLQIDDTQKFGNLINYTKNILLESIAHQEFPFEKIVKVVNPGRYLNMNPIFQVAVQWITYSTKPLKFVGFNAERVGVKEGISPFDITFNLWENDGQIEGEVYYNIDILKRDTIIRLIDNFIRLVQSVVENPDSAVGSISMISDADKMLIDSINSTKTDYPKDKTIAQLFEDMVNLYPDKTAVVFKGNSLTYSQLNEKSNQLARVLRNSNVSANVPVGILVDKSVDMIVGILGILKAGGAYVPLDPEYPEFRKNFIIKDSGCKVLVTQNKYITETTEGIKKVSLDSSSSYHNDKSNIEGINVSSDPAFIIYTSGTTGAPKGTLIPQRGVVRLVCNTNYIEITTEDRVLLVGAIVFDATTLEIWSALLNGGSLYIIDKETLLNSEALEQEISLNGITCLIITSAFFTHLVENRITVFSKLKYLMVGGDILSCDHANRVRKFNTDMIFINGYGPTENTTMSTFYRINKDFESNIPIGKPNSNSTVYIFDKNMNYQPIGVVGELYVGGDGLSKGYLNREDLTRTKFIDNPHKSGERLYRTEDMARWLPDGNIEFHGRIDNQLKIRGFRVELGEIESVISEVDGVIEAVVKPVKLVEGDYRLVAFLNVPETFNMETKKIVSEIKAKLPGYMLPSTFKFIHGFPKTINGKIDREALSIDISELEKQRTIDVNTFSSTERIIHKVWCEVIKTDDISLTDNFFDVGGNSLLAISVMSEIESVFNINIGLRVFFDSPRIKDLAEIVDIASLKISEKNPDENKEKTESKIITGEI